MMSIASGLLTAGGADIGNQKADHGRNDRLIMTSVIPLRRH